LNDPSADGSYSCGPKDMMRQSNPSTPVDPVPNAAHLRFPPALPFPQKAMSVYSIPPILYPPKILQRPAKWGLSRGRRQSAANLMNALRINQTEIVSMTIQPLRRTRRQEIWDGISAG
jgi:hypothetical protein